MHFQNETSVFNFLWYCMDRANKVTTLHSIVFFLCVWTDSVFFRFLQVQVEGFDYVGLGSASNKKDAETNAAKDFCGFLIGAGIIPPDSFPDDLFVSINNKLKPHLLKHVLNVKH